MSQGGCSTWLYRLQLTAQGHEAALTPLKVPKVNGLIPPVNGLSAGADGNTVAYSASPCSQGQDGLVGVISLRTGRVRTWRLNATSARSVSLSPDGRTLAFVDTVVYGGDGTVRTMPADAPRSGHASGTPGAAPRARRRRERQHRAERVRHGDAGLLGELA